MRLLLRLYPLDWRERYGVEFEALLEDAKPSARNALDVLWGGLKMQLKTWSLARITVAFSILGILVGAAISFALPAHYVSQANLIVAPADESATLAANTVNQQSSFDREALASIIQDCDLYPRDRGRVSQDELIDKMNRNIRLIAAPVASARNRNAVTFDVQFDYPNRYVAQRVNEELMRLLLARNLYTDKVSLTFRVLAPPSLPRLPGWPVPVRFICAGLVAGLLGGLLVTVVIKSRTATTA